MSEQTSDSTFDEPVHPVRTGSRRRWVRIAIICVVSFVPIAVVAWQPVMEALEASHRSSCKCFLKHIGLALHNYHDTYGTFPPAFVLGPDGRPWHSWRVLILPYLECKPLYDEYHFD